MSEEARNALALKELPFYLRFRESSLRKYTLEREANTISQKAYSWLAQRHEYGCPSVTYFFSME